MPEQGAAADGKLTVFISYSRKDEAFAQELVAGLAVAGFAPYLDRHEIAAGEDWEARLGRLIEAADTVVFVISPDAVASERCAWEMERTEQLKKRLLPIVWRGVAEAIVPERLKRLNYIFFDRPHTFGPSLAALATALRTDLGWIREHTRFGEAALRWDARGRANALLLRGEELAATKEWVKTQPQYAPEPTLLMQEFFKASETDEAARAGAERQRLEQMAAAQAERAKALDAEKAALRQAEAAQQQAAELQRKRARLRNVALVAVTIVAALAGWQAWVAEERRAEANQQKERAEQRTDDARRNLQLAHSTASLFRETQSVNAFISGDAVTAMLLALDGVPDEQAEDEFQRSRPIVEETVSTLALAWEARRERTVLSDNFGQRTNADFSPDGTRVLTVSSSGETVRLWTMDGRQLATLDGHSHWVFSAIFSSNGARILTASDDKSARLWDKDGKLLATLTGHTDSVKSAVFSPDNSRILTASDDKSARLWDMEGNQLATLSGHRRELYSAVFSPDGTRILTVSADGTARLWDKEGRPFAILNRHTDRVKSAVFSGDGARILTASSDRTARLWDKEGNALAALVGHRGEVNSAVFSPDNLRILTASYDNTARLWDMEGNSLEILAGHEGIVVSAAFSPDGAHILTASEDGTARLWARDGKPLATQLGHKDILRGHTSHLNRAVFSPDSARILTASADGTVRLWDRVQPRRTMSDWTVQRLVDHAKQDVPRCLTPKQREDFRLPATPPAWCIAMRKWPYDSAAASGRAP
jgi:WD40 repeat protein